MHMSVKPQNLRGTYTLAYSVSVSTRKDIYITFKLEYLFGGRDPYEKVSGALEQEFKCQCFKPFFIKLGQIQGHVS